MRLITPVINGSFNVSFLGGTNYPLKSCTID